MQPSDAVYGDVPPCAPCGVPFSERLWARFDYTLWWFSGMGLPPLVTTSAEGTPIERAGVLGDADTETLLGSHGDRGTHLGGRVSTGFWLDSCRCNGFEASYLGVGGGVSRFRASSDETPILARPYFDAQLGQEAAMVVAFPDVIRGSVEADLQSELHSVEVLWRHRLLPDSDSRTDFVLGYRFLRLNDGLHLRQFSEWTAAQGAILPGTTKELFDSFDTVNSFHGAELGVVYGERSGPWSLDLAAKLGMGGTHMESNVTGGTRTTVPGGGSADFTGGLLAQETNIGRRIANKFALVPELAVSLGQDLTPRLRVIAGYNLLYWSHVVRPGDQIDLVASQLPPESPTGERRPSSRLVTSGFWAHALTLGLDYRF